MEANQNQNQTQNQNQSDDAPHACGDEEDHHVASEETIHENGEDPNQNDTASDPPPANRTYIIDLNTVLLDSDDDNDYNSQVVEAASNMKEHPEVTEPAMNDNVYEHPCEITDQFNLDIGQVNKPKVVIQISDSSDSEITQTDDEDLDRPITYNFFRTEPDTSPEHEHGPSGIVTFTPSGNDSTGESSSAGARKRKFTGEFVKEEEEDDDDII